MKHLLQSLRTGALDTPEVPCPAPKRGEVLFCTRKSLISAGTERMLLEFGRSNWLEKARRQPEKVHQLLDKIRTDGLLPAIEAVQAKLDQPLSIGYSNAGVVLESDVYSPGTRVVSNGPHAEVVRVPKNLTAAIPPGVSDESAAFTVVGAVALEGIRLLSPSLGETIAVSGLGLIGLLAVQLLRAQGCRVLGIDYDESRLALAAGFGAETVSLARGEDPVSAALRLTNGLGVDGVLIAAATQSDEPVHLAAEMCRKRGRVVLTGVAGLHLSRDDFYKKELTFQVSCSYGPGRYDPAYERDGRDYPPGYVRWTAQRNFAAVLQLMQERHLSVEPLITHRFSFEQVGQAYSLLGSDEPSLGILLDYPDRASPKSLSRTVQVISAPTSRVETAQSRALGEIAVIGAGNYATRVLLPALRRAGVRPAVIVSSSGTGAQQAARRFEIPRASSDASSVLQDPSIGPVVIATRHDSHAGLVCEAIRNGKHVFVEKPLALRCEELEEIEAEFTKRAASVMVGFNRRFAPHAKKMRELLATEPAPKSVVITVNAGSVPSDHWTLDAELGGGRLIGEGCHFIDLARFLVGRLIVAARWHQLAQMDNATLLMEFEEGSQAMVHYFVNGHRRYPKERVEVFAGGKVLALDNWRKMRGYGWKGFSRLNLWRQDKGNAACIAAWLQSIETKSPPPIPFTELMEVSRWTLQATER